MKMETIDHRGEKRRRRIMSDCFSTLPAKSTTDILSRLPADSVVGCRHVCKSWRTLIDDPSFVDTHIRRLISSSNDKGTKSSFNFFLCQYRSGSCKFHFVEYNLDENRNSIQLRKQPISTHHHPIPLNFGNLYHNFMGSCNGLVFLGSVLPSVEGFFICNPFTREYINLLPLTQQEGGYMVYGFGYHPFTNEYKVVSIHYKSGSRSPGPGQISVYTLGSGRWRKKGEIQHQLVLNRRPGLLANGALYWMKMGDRKIVSFDLADEEFRIVPSPPPPLSPNDIVDELGVLDGCLCVTRSDKTRYESPKEIWVLNHNTNVNMIINPEESWSWTKEFSIPWKGITHEAEPHVVLKGGKVLLRDHNGLVSYDPNAEYFTKSLGMFQICYVWFDIIPYTKSFVSLKALGEEDAKSFGAAQALQQE